MKASNPFGRAGVNLKKTPARILQMRFITTRRFGNNTALMAELSKIPARDLALAPGITMSQFSMVITGDMSFGENYQAREEERGRENILKTRGYAYTMEKIAPLLRNSDLVLCNLETVVTDHEISPFAQTKGYVHWSDIRETPKQLLAHNIRSVSLANNHTIDYGVPGLRQTLDVLSEAGITSFGAGMDIDEARLPFSHEVTLSLPPFANKQLRIHAFAAFAVDNKYENKFRAYAGPATPGTNPLQLNELCRDVVLTKALDPECFVITILHWRRDYRWRSQMQLDAARALLEAGTDLIIGHGSHMMQQIEKVDGRWVAHGLGNFVFNSPGRYEAMGMPPYSLVGRLVFTQGQRPDQLRLYPIVTNNRATRYQSRFVTESEFQDVYGILLHKSPEPELFTAEIGTGLDRFGRYLNMPTKCVSPPR